MKVIKNINNNVALCLDNHGREVIAFGKGIGFRKPPYEIEIKDVERTFYDFKEIDFEIINAIPSSVLQASIEIVDTVENNLNITLISSTTLALADHIHFAIQRKDENISVNLAIYEDVRHLHPKEMQAALHALEIIQKHTDVRLDAKEASPIAMYFINNQAYMGGSEELLIKELVEESLAIIENRFAITVNRDSYNYTRFLTHMHYLVKRTFSQEEVDDTSLKILNTFHSEYPEVMDCAAEVSDLYREKLKVDLKDEERMYIAIHINRLCSEFRKTVHR